MQQTVDDVTKVVASTLSIEDRLDTLHEGTPLFGAMPELDSMSVLELVAVLEERFAIQITDDEITGEVFETIGSLAALVERKTADGA